MDANGSDHGTEMSDTRSRGLLYERGHAVMSVARDDDAYAVPVSCGYDERILLYLLQFGETSEKLAVVEETGRASLTVYDVRTREDWECIVPASVDRSLITTPTESGERVLLRDVRTLLSALSRPVEVPAADSGKHFCIV